MIVAGLVLALATSAWAGEAEKPKAAEPASPQAVASAHQVLRLFHAKCFSCHDPSQGKPEGDFGYVMDLARLAGNRDLIVPFQPDDSELWFILDFDEMPPADSDVAPLTDAEKEAVRQWIEQGAAAVPWSGPESVAASQPEVAESVADAAAETANMAVAAVEPARAARPWFRRWVGKFHPASVHIPIAMALAALVAEGLGMVTGRRSLKEVVRFCLWFGALGGLAAAGLGWLHAEGGVFVGDRRTALELHRWLGVAGAAGLLLTAALSEGRLRFEGPRTRLALRGALLITAGLMAVAGFLGGGLTHGLDHYRW